MEAYAVPVILSPHEASKVYVGIQALRFIAALLVVLTHATLFVSERLDGRLGVWHPGAHGVEVFFVVSGFVMAATSAPYRSAGGWLVFAKRRIARIVPLYWLATTVKSVISVAGPGLAYHSRFAPGSMAMSFLFIPFRNDGGRVDPLLGVGWTLNFEMVFYALFTLALLSKIDWLLFTAPVLIIAALASLLPRENWPVALNFYCNPIVLDFLAGMLIARWAPHMGAPRRVLASLAGAAGMGLLIAPDGALPLPLAGTTCLGASLVVGALVNVEPVLKRFCPAWLSFLGGASYAIYLFHPIVAPAVPTAFRVLHVGNAPLAITLCIAVAVAAGALIYRYIEKPLSRSASALLRIDGGRQP